MKYNAKKIADELLKGNGYFVVPKLFSKKDVKTAREQIISIAKSYKATENIKKNMSELAVLSVTNHVWNLIDKHEVFRKLVQHDLIMEVFSIILGNELKLGSFAARIQQPGDKRQLPHLDYPYWDMYNLKSFPKHINSMGVEIENNIENALKWCDVANVLRIQLERQNNKFFPSLREYSLYYGINKKLLEKINKNIIIMHPGPINRGVELNSDVADSNNSIILDQVENGVAIRMAVMYLLSLNKG